MKKLYQNIVIWWGLKKLKNIEPKREDATLAYVDSEGNKWFTAIPSELDPTRGLAAWLLSDDIKRGLTKDLLKTGFKRMTDFYNKGEPAEAIKIVGVLEAGLELYALPEVLLNIATCYTFLNDEPAEYKQIYQKQKRDIWEKDYNCKAFFLQYASEYTKKYSQSPPSNVLEYFQKMKPILDQIQRLAK